MTIPTFNPDAFLTKLSLPYRPAGRYRDEGEVTHKFELDYEKLTTEEAFSKLFCLGCSTIEVILSQAIPYRIVIEDVDTGTVHQDVWADDLPTAMQKARLVPQ